MALLLPSGKGLISDGKLVSNAEECCCPCCPHGPQDLFFSQSEIGYGYCSHVSAGRNIRIESIAWAGTPRLFNQSCGSGSTWQGTVGQAMVGVYGNDSLGNCQCQINQIGTHQTDVICRVQCGWWAVGGYYNYFLTLVVYIVDSWQILYLFAADPYTFARWLWPGPLDRDNIITTSPAPWCNYASSVGWGGSVSLSQNPLL